MRQRVKKNIIWALAIAGIVCFSSLTKADLNSGLIAHFKFEENTNDSSGNGNNSIEHGKIKYVSGVVGKAGSFNGIDDYLTIDSLLSSELQGEFSINAWVNVSDEWLNTRDLYRSSAKYMSVVGYGTDLVGNWTNQVDFGLIIENYFETETRNSISFVTTGNSENGVIVRKNNSTLVNKWVQITALYENGTSKLYVDGVFIGEKKLLENLGNKHSLIIGGSSVTQQWNRSYKGLLDEVRIYNRALSEKEIQELYNERSTNEDEPEEPIASFMPEEKILYIPRVKVNTEQYSAKLALSSVNNGLNWV